MVPLYPPASRSAITPVFCLSHLISFCHLCAGLFFPSPPYFFAPRSCLFIGALHSTRHVSLLHFYPSSCRSLNPLSFALLCPHPSRFSSCSPEATFACSPISTYSPRFPHSSWFISYLLSVPFIPLSSICATYIAIPLHPLAQLSPSYTFLTVFPLTSQVFLQGFKFIRLSSTTLTFIHPFFQTPYFISPFSVFHFFPQLLFSSLWKSFLFLAFLFTYSCYFVFWCCCPEVPSLPPLFFFFLSPLYLCIPAGPPSLIRSLSTEPHVSESIRAESRRGRSFTEVNIKLHQAPRRKRGRERRGEREPSVPNPPHRSGGDEGNILFWQDTILRRAPLSPAIDFFFLSFFLSFSPPQWVGRVCVLLCVRTPDTGCACAFACCFAGHLGVCMCTGVWMGDNRNSIRKCGEEMRMVLLVGLCFYKQAPV